MAQCAGWTLKGDRCKRTAVAGSEYCNTHQYQNGQEEGPRKSKAESAGGSGKDGPAEGQAHCWTDPATWDRDTVLLTALGAFLAAALVLSRGRR